MNVLFIISHCGVPLKKSAKAKDPTRSFNILVSRTTWHFDNYRMGYPAANVLVSLRNRADSPEHSLFEHENFGTEKKKKKKSDYKLRHLAWIRFLRNVLFHYYAVLVHVSASSRDTPILLHANNQNADQPAHPRKLISAFCFPFLESTIPKFVTSKISRF